MLDSGLNLKQPTNNSQALKVWLVLNNTSFSDIGRTIGVSPQYVQAVFAGYKKPSAIRREQMIQLGIPESLIPQSARARGGSSDSGGI